MDIKKISAGAFGCLVKPGIPCKEKGFTNKISNFIGLKRDKKEVVSKIVKKNQIENEYKPELFNEIKKIDNYNSYYIIPQEVCKLKEKYKNTIKQVCAPHFGSNNNGVEKENEELYTLLMEAAKKDFSKIELDTDELINNLINISKGFRLLHEKNIIHRDIKIKNIVLAEGKSKIIDWGNATIGEQEVKEGGDNNYLSPEYRRIRIEEKDYLNTLNKDSSRLANNLINNFSVMNPDKQLDYLNNFESLEKKSLFVESLSEEKKDLLLTEMTQEQELTIRHFDRFKKSIKNSFLIYTNLLDTEATNFNRNNSFGKEILKVMEKKYISSFDINDPYFVFSDMSNTELAKKNDVFMLGITFLILLNNYLNKPRRRKANMSDQNFIKKMITLIKKMLNPNLDMYPRNKNNNKSRITMQDVENELTKLKEMFKSGVWVKEPIQLNGHKPTIRVAPVLNFNKVKPSVVYPVAQTAGYGRVNNHGKTIKNKKSTRKSRSIKPYIKPNMLSNYPELRKEIISQRQEERKIRQIQDKERERVKEIKSIKNRSVFGKILQSLPGDNGRRELLSFTSKALDNPYPN